MHPEIKDWGKVNCALNVQVSFVSKLHQLRGILAFTISEALKFGSSHFFSLFSVSGPMTIVVFRVPIFQFYSRNCFDDHICEKVQFLQSFKPRLSKQSGIFHLPFRSRFFGFLHFSAVVYIRLSGFRRFLPFFRFLMGINVSLLLVTGQKGR